MSSIAIPTASTLVHKEECTLCFDNQDSPLGLDVCLTCFNGGCPVNSVNQHSLAHFVKSGHATFVNLRRKRKVVEAAVARDDEPPIKKLAIRAEVPDEIKYEFVTVTKRYLDASGSSEVVQNDTIDSSVRAVLASQSSAQKSEVKAWEEEIIDCAHTRECAQLESTAVVGTTCSHPECSLTSPLWLCLVCGSLGCGRKQFGGAAGGGEGHGLDHYKLTGHAIAVKMGTIEIGGTGDVYCYPCDDARIDPHLSKHLHHFGINVGEMTKTEKSMTELQIEQNLKFDFAMTGSDGKDLEPVFGPGLTGLKNLGNSCYLASTLQSLFSLPAFRSRYLASFHTHPFECRIASPANCLECQLGKIADGLLSGRYSVLSERDPDDEMKGFASPAISGNEPIVERKVGFQEGIKPTMFKALVGKDHPEFSTMKQQDADEFLKHVLKSIRQGIKSQNDVEGQDPTRDFSFSNQTRLQCGTCRGVRYGREEQESVTVPVAIKEIQSGEMNVAEGGAGEIKKQYEPVQLIDCFASLMSTSEVDYHCPACDKKVVAYKTTQFETFPKVLSVNASRFQYVNWVPTKVDVPVVVPYDALLSLDRFVGKGKQEGEVELPKEETTIAIQFDADAMSQLMGMGFPEIRCQRGLLATGNGNAEQAMNWLFEHMDDSDIDAPLPVATSAPSSTNAKEPTEDLISSVTEMGFTIAQARKALKETDCDIGRAIEWLFSHPDDQGEELTSNTDAAAITPATIYGSSTLPAEYRLKSFISHKGPSVHAGHYVAHVRTTEGNWVLFNDEKVVKADQTAIEALLPFAYIYIFERV